MGKKTGVILSLLSVSIFTLNFVSANWIDELGGGFQNVYRIIDVLITNFITPFVQLVLTSGNESISGDMLFAKLLFFLIVLGFVHFALDKAKMFEDKKGLHWIIVGVVAILATRYLGTEALIQTIILPYSVLGIAISAGLPFIIYALFIEMGFKNSNDNDFSILRKVAWVFFIVIFIGLWYARRPVIEQAGSYAGYIYPVTILASILVLLFDGTIQRVWLKSELNRTITSMASRTAREMKREVNNLYADLKTTEYKSTDWWGVKKQIEDMQEQIIKLLHGKI